MRNAMSAVVKPGESVRIAHVMTFLPTKVAIHSAKSMISHTDSSNVRRSIRSGNRRFVRFNPPSLSTHC